MESRKGVRLQYSRKTLLCRGPIVSGEVHALKRKLRTNARAKLCKSYVYYDRVVTRKVTNATNFIRTKGKKYNAALTNKTPKEILTTFIVLETV